MKGRFMIVRDYGSKLLLLLVFSMVGMVCCNAQSGKSLSVKKVMCTASPEGEAVPSLLDENGIEFQPLDVVNWKDYPYKPEVSFRIAHTGARNPAPLQSEGSQCACSGLRRQWPGMGRCLCGILRISRR